jgi:HSP20 family protein
MPGPLRSAIRNPQSTIRNHMKHRLLSELTAIENQLSQLIKSHNVFTVEQPNSTWSPAVDIYETPDYFFLTAEVPGVRSPDIDVKVIDSNLILRGERRWEGDVKGEQFHRLESSYGKFERIFSLSEKVDADRISAELEHGVLKVTLPKRAKSSSKQIEINKD